MKKKRLLINERRSKRTKSRKTHFLAVMLKLQGVMEMASLRKQKNFLVAKKKKRRADLLPQKMMIRRMLPKNLTVLMLRWSLEMHKSAPRMEHIHPCLVIVSLLIWTQSRRRRMRLRHRTILKMQVNGKILSYWVQISSVAPTWVVVWNLNQKSTSHRCKS